MNIRTLTALLAVAALLFAAAVFATPEPAGRQTARPRPPVDTTLDANGDEMIDAGEISAASRALLKIDRNSDGRLTADEYLPPRPDGAGENSANGAGNAPPDRPPQRTRAAGPKPPIVTAIDANADGILEASEIAAAPSALAKLDVNADGRLTPDEYRPARPAGEERPSRGEGEKDPAARRLPREIPTPASTSSTANSTSGPVISGVLLAFDPLRLVISGSGFRQGASVTVAGKAAPVTVLRNSGLIVASGSSLETALPKGTAVSIVVVNPGGAQSPSWSFIR